jgi:hypothetical protein
MSEYIELGTFQELLKSRETYSKAVEAAAAIDDDLDGRSRPDYDPTDSYKKVVHELLSMKSEDDPDGDSSILITLETDDINPEAVEEYVNVSLLNNEYDENLDAIDGEDLRQYPILAIDFATRATLLDKKVLVTSEIKDTVPTGVTLEDYALGNILWEITFYGFNEKDVETKKIEIQEASKQASIEVGDFSEFESYISRKFGDIA